MSPDCESNVLKVSLDIRLTEGVVSFLYIITKIIKAVEATSLSLNSTAYFHPSPLSLAFSTCSVWR